jgi:acyl-ACP thioesterase
MRPAADTATDLVAPPAGARVYEQQMRAGLGDCAPSGRIRLDALARWLQDIAYADVEDAGVAHLAVWVVRRSRMSIQRFPRFAEAFTLRTFCSGLGRMWAERRTTVEHQGEPVVEAVSLWVHLDPSDGRPMPFSQEEVEAYGDHAAGRRITARLRHPQPGQALLSRRWHFRASECDIADHVNNAAYWTPLDEELLEAGADPERLDAEMEFRTPAQPGEKLVLAQADRRWIVSPDSETHASLVFAAA